MLDCQSLSIKCKFFCKPFCQFWLPIFIIAFAIKLPIPVFAGTTAPPPTFICNKGPAPGPSPANCRRNSASAQFECQRPSSAEINRRLRSTPPDIGGANALELRNGMGCEQASSGINIFHCCLQFCEDGVTPIYYKDVTEYDASATPNPNAHPATERCTQAGPCPSDPSKICFQPNPVDSLFFCCPPLPQSTTIGGLPTLPGGLPTGDECQDLGGRDCQLKDFLCNNTLYFDLMTWQCPQTCNRCPADGSQPPRPPAIQNPPLPNRDCMEMLDCPVWRQNGFCQSEFYSNTTKASICPISCQLGCALDNVA